MSTFNASPTDALLIGSRSSSSFDNLYLPPEEPVEPTWRSWGKRVVAVGGAIGSIAIRAADYSRWTNVLGSFGAGFSIQGLIELGAKDDRLARIRQVCLTVFGQVSLFALSQAFANTDDEAWKMYLTHAIIAQFGANVEIAAKWLYQQGAIRIETSSSERLLQRATEAPCISHNLSHVMKALAAGGAGVGSLVLSDPIFKGLSSFISSFYISQIVGERLIDWIDKRIERNDVDQGPSLSLAAGTRYRLIKTILITIGYIAQPLSLTPWTTPDTSQRLKQLVFVGLTLGFFDGIRDRGEIKRVERLGLENLPELEKLSAPERTPHRSDLYRHLAYRIGHYAVPVLSVGGLIGFTVWQEGFELNRPESRIELGTMLAGFLGTYSVGKWADETWNSDQAPSFKRTVMERIWYSFRLLGMNPLFVYYAGTNSLRMDSNATDGLKNPYYAATVIAAWAAYGASMARELVVTSSNRLGTAQLKFPRMLFINAATTTALSLRGINP